MKKFKVGQEVRIEYKPDRYIFGTVTKTDSKEIQALITVGNSYYGKGDEQWFPISNVEAASTIETSAVKRLERVAIKHFGIEDSSKEMAAPIRNCKNYRSDNNTCTPGCKEESVAKKGNCPFDEGKEYNPYGRSNQFQQDCACFR